MRNFKKFAAMVSALTLAACAVAPVASFATVTKTAVDNGLITINTEESDHTYSAYQIFDGTLTKEKDDKDTPETTDDTTTIIFTEVVWGSGIKQTVTGTPDSVSGKTIYKALADLEIMNSSKNVFMKDNPAWTATINEGNEVTDPTWVPQYIVLESAKEVSEALQKINSNADIDKIAAVFVKYKTDTATATNAAYDSTNKKYVISITDPGYYLVTDTANPKPPATGLADGEAISKYMLQVAGETALNPKADAPKVMKKVKEDTYTPATLDNVTFPASNYTLKSGYNDAADYSIGEDIPFSLYGSLPETFANYKGYYYKFTDTMGAGLDLVDTNNDGKITIDDFTVTVIDGGDSVPVPKRHLTLVETTSSKGFTIAIDDLKKIDMNAATDDIDVMSKNAIIKVDYVATLNQSAIIGNPGNPNDVYLTYSNDSNTAQGGDNDTTTNTEKDYNVIFTYELDVTKYLDKIHDNNKAAKGEAGFMLYKDDNNWAKLDKIITDNKGDEDPTNDEVKYKFNSWVGKKDATEMFTQTGGTFALEGIQDGTYYLKETTTPDSYNTISDITVVITAEGDDNNSDTNKASVTDIVLQNYKETKDTAEGKVLKDLTIQVNGGDVESSTDTNKGMVDTNVINNKGNELPSTGGIGTTIFYLGGGAMVAVAGVFLITKKRMGKREN